MDSNKSNLSKRLRRGLRHTPGDQKNTQAVARIARLAFMNDPLSKIVQLLVIKLSNFLFVSRLTFYGVNCLNSDVKTRNLGSFYLKHCRILMQPDDFF